MAVNLKARKKCHIVPPDWLNYGELVRLVSFLGLTDNLGAEHLQDCLKEETTSEAFSVLPFRYAEVSKVLLDM